MRNIAALIIGALALTCSFNSAMAQNFSGAGSGQRATEQTDAQQDSVVFTLQLTDDHIEMLRSGEDLESLIPEHLHGKVKRIKLSYAGSQRTADRTHENQPNNRQMPLNNGTGLNSDFDNSSGQSNRFDSNRRGTSTDGAGNQTIPRFTPQPGQSGQTSTTGQQVNNDLFDRRANNNMVSPTPRNLGRDYGQYDRPIGPQYQETPRQARNPYGNQGMQDQRALPRQPQVDPNRFKGQPAGTQPENEFRQPRSWQQNQPTDTRLPRDGSGNSDFDTANRGSNVRPVYPTTPSRTMPRDLPTTQRQPPQDRYAANDYQPNNQNYNGQLPPQQYGSDSVYDPRSASQAAQQGYNPNDQYARNSRASLVAGHDLPFVRNQIPRLAARPGYPAAQTSGTLPAASIPGDMTPDGMVKQNDGPNDVTGHSPVSQLNQFNNFLYFLLLCSIGLNIYLAWISRGFYVRYRELADELRDTFSTV